MPLCQLPHLHGESSQQTLCSPVVVRLDHDFALGQYFLTLSFNFSIQGDYDTIVIDKDRFLTHQRSQMANLLGCDERNINNMTARRGSVVVNMVVEGYDEMSAADLDRATKDLAQAFSEGKISLVRRGGGNHFL
jgi:hypothetical protein